VQRSELGWGQLPPSWLRAWKEAGYLIRSLRGKINNAIEKTYSITRIFNYELSLTFSRQVAVTVEKATTID